MVCTGITIQKFSTLQCSVTIQNHMLRIKTMHRNARTKHIEHQDRFHTFYRPLLAIIVIIKQPSEINFTLFLNCVISLTLEGDHHPVKTLNVIILGVVNHRHVLATHQHFTPLRKLLQISCGHYSAYKTALRNKLYNILIFLICVITLTPYAIVECQNFSNHTHVLATFLWQPSNILI